MKDDPSDDVEDFERWYYGGTPPAGDFDDGDAGRAAEALTGCLNRRRAATPQPTP